MMSQQAQSSGQKASSESSESHVGYPIEELLNCENKPAKTDTAFFTYGRFQPGHIGHKIMIDQLLRQAKQHNTTTGTKITPEKTNVYVFVSQRGGQKEKKQQKKQKQSQQRKQQRKQKQSPKRKQQRKLKQSPQRKQQRKLKQSLQRKLWKNQLK